MYGLLDSPWRFTTAWSSGSFCKQALRPSSCEPETHDSLNCVNNQKNNLKDAHPFVLSRRLMSCFPGLGKTSPLLGSSQFESHHNSSSTVQNSYMPVTVPTKHARWFQPRHFDVPGNVGFGTKGMAWRVSVISGEQGCSAPSHVQNRDRVCYRRWQGDQSSRTAQMPVVSTWLLRSRCLADL